MNMFRLNSPKAVAAIAALLMFGTTIVQAQDPSTKAIRLIVPFPPGGATDNLGRMLGRQMAAELGQQVLVENRPGAGGNLGADIVAKSKLDGDVMLLTTSTLASAPSIYAKLPFDPLKDFRAIGEVGRVPFVLVSPIDAPFKTFDEFIAYAKAHPGELSYASPGNGTPIHLYSELLQKRTGIQLIHVPYAGGNQPKIDLIAGRIAIMFESPVTALPSIKGKQVRALATSRPIATAPEIPTIASTGLLGFEPEVWYGLVAPSGAADDRVQRLNAALNAALKTDDVSNWLKDQGASKATVSSTRDFQKIVNDDVANWAAIVKESGAKID
ncbi:tripartite tricarboxylate transporter substrate binding protein [soil metagenome]